MLIAIRHLLIATLCFAASTCVGADSNPKVRSTVIVVRPKEWVSALADWKKYRQAKYDVIEVDSRESAQQIRFDILKSLARATSPVKSVLLCGDVAVAANPTSNNDKASSQGANRDLVTLLPTFEIPTVVKLGPYTTPTLATDIFYGDIDDDLCPDLSIGRLPAKNAGDLKRMLARSIEYETSQSYGPWRNRIHATAGVGGFGVLADTAIESVTRRILSEGIPDRFQLQMTYASLSSAYCPDPKQLTNSFIGKLNQGGLFWVYIGHGNVHHLDDFSVGNETLPICNGEHIAQFDIQDGLPVAIMLACFTGAFDAKIDCFAEMLLANNQGPIAVIAGSRVTMPYGLSQFSTELMDGCFVDRTETLGEIVLNAKRKVWRAESVNTNHAIAGNASLRSRQNALIENMATALSPEGHDLTEERREHVRLMNLLGDPLLSIRHPTELQIHCESKLEAGNTMLIQGRSPFPGKLRLELALTRDRLPDGLRTIANFVGTPEQRQTMQENYLKASELTVVGSEQTVGEGEFSVELLVPNECRGRCVVRAIVYGSDDWATGSQRVIVNRKR
ncbi:MAG: C25 family cysteine peptidase [Pirellula sp.]